VQAIAVHRRRQPAAVGPKQLGASGVLYILDLRHRIKVDSVVAGDANQFDRVFFTIAAGTFVAIAMWFLQFCALFFISVRLCSALRHCGAVLPIATGCLVCLGVTALFVVGLFATSSIPSALPPTDALTGRGFSCFRNSCGVAFRVGQVGGSTGIACSYGCPRGTICNDGGAVLLLQPRLRHGDAGPAARITPPSAPPRGHHSASAEGPDGSEVESTRFSSGAAPSTAAALSTLPHSVQSEFRAQRTHHHRQHTYRDTFSMHTAWRACTLRRICCTGSIVAAAAVCSG
jgi:hypothetical protein